jgi:hypothetical protein
MEPKEWMAIKNEIIKEGRMDELMEHAAAQEQEMLSELDDSEVFDYMISKMNFCRRKQLLSCQPLNVKVRVGDICFIDFGMAYLLEVGYQHFGMILAFKNGKAFVVPMSGNQKAAREAWSKSNARGKTHLMRLGNIAGLNKSSVLFLNDAKWINTSRIIDVKAHIPVSSRLFQTIQRRVKECIG